MDSGLQSTAQLFSQDGSGGCTLCYRYFKKLFRHATRPGKQKLYIPIITVAFKVQVEIEIPEYQAPSVALE